MELNLKTLLSLNICDIVNFIVFYIGSLKCTVIIQVQLLKAFTLTLRADVKFVIH